MTDRDELIERLESLAVFIDVGSPLPPGAASRIHDAIALLRADATQAVAVTDEEICKTLASIYEHDDSFGQVRNGRLIIDGDVPIENVGPYIRRLFAAVQPKERQP